MKFILFATILFSISSFATSTLNYKCQGLTLEQAELMSQFGELDEVYANGGSTEAADLIIEIQASKVAESSDRFKVRRGMVRALPHSPNSRPMSVDFAKGNFVMTYDYGVLTGRNSELSLHGPRGVTKLRVPGTYGFHYFLAKCELQ